MDNKKTIQRVREITDTYRRNPNKTIKELKRLVKEGQETGDIVLIGAAYRAIAYVCIQTGDRGGSILRKHRIYDDTIGFYIALEAY